MFCRSIGGDDDDDDERMVVLMRTTTMLMLMVIMAMLVNAGVPSDQSRAFLGDKPEVTSSENKLQPRCAKMMILTLPVSHVSHFLSACRFHHHRHIHRHLLRHHHILYHCASGTTLSDLRSFHQFSRT